MKAPIKRSPTPDAEIELALEPNLQQIVDIKLVEKERLKELLRERLVECGWRDEMKALCREYTRKKGRNDVTVDELVNVMTPKGRVHSRHVACGQLEHRQKHFNYCQLIKDLQAS